MITKRKTRVLSDLYPAVWEQQFKDTGQQIDVIEFNNIQHFKQALKKVKLNKDGSADQQGVPFKDALKDLIVGKSVINKKQFTTIKDEVKSVLHKRGLISENVYEGYKYDIEGHFIDIAEYIAGNPECMLKPKIAYKNFFYELFISAAYLSNVSDSTVKKNVAKILATIQLLEKEHIYIKVTIVAASSDTIEGENGLVVAIPLFSHKEEKTIETMSSIINERFFRTFIFGLREDKYGEKLSGGYGRTIDLKETIILHDVNVEKIAENILNKVITPGVR